MDDDDLKLLLGNIFDQGGLASLEATIAVLGKHPRRNRRALRTVRGLYASPADHVASR